MTGKKKNKTILIAVTALVLAGVGVYGYMNVEKLEVMVKKTSLSVVGLTRECCQLFPK